MELFVGGKYVGARNCFVRVIERIHGADIYWRDDFGPNKCQAERFLRWAHSMAPDSPPPPAIGPKRRRYFTSAKIKELKSELVILRPLRDPFPYINELDGFPFMVRELIETGVLTIQKYLEKLTEALDELPRAHNRLQACTRIDGIAEMMQRLIPDVHEALASRPSSEENIERQLRVLSEGLESVNRLRENLSDYLGN
jgi:hypothetical protein